MRTTPTNVLLDLNGEQPLKTRWQFLLDKLICKITARLSHPLNSTLLQTCHLRHNERTHLSALVDTYLTHSHIFKQIEQFHLPGYLEFPYPIRHFKPFIDTDSGFPLRIKEDIDNDITEAFNSLLQEQNVDVTYYTDGSRACVDGQYRMGFAVFSPETDLPLKKRINNHSSIFEAEASAIEEALRIIIGKRTPKSIICSDSLSVLTNLQASAPSDNSNHIISRIKKSMFSCNQLGLLVKLIWIPIHHGIAGNETADSLAKESLHLPDPFLQSKCHYTNLYSRFKKIAKEKAIEILQSESLIKSSRYFEIIDSPLSPPWYNTNKEGLTRPVISLISRLRAQHAVINAHLWEKNIISSSACSCGHAFQDLNHIFF
ncbi:pol-like protein [Lasius niger]|uniref:Pol-like protein n=1 Tax=Lasius niger TaxID=67767 RepID=A0A0J7KJL1_LASNI|nr:pol-like protein [Lasius niger]